MGRHATTVLETVSTSCGDVQWRQDRGAARDFGIRIADGSAPTSRRSIHCSRSGTTGSRTIPSRTCGRRQHAVAALEASSWRQPDRSHRDRLLAFTMKTRGVKLPRMSSASAWARQFFNDTATGGVYVNFMSEDGGPRRQASSASIQEGVGPDESRSRIHRFPSRGFLGVRPDPCPLTGGLGLRQPSKKISAGLCSEVGRVRAADPGGATTRGSHTYRMRPSDIIPPTPPLLERQPRKMRKSVRARRRWLSYNRGPDSSAPRARAGQPHPDALRKRGDRARRSRRGRSG